MKAILLSAATGLMLFILCTACLRYCRPHNRVRVLGGLFLALLPLLALAHIATPPDLGFLSRDSLVSIPGLDLVFATALYATGFFGGILQLYNLADRGLSLRVLIDILENSSGKMSADEIMRSYGSGKGIIWMYDKRIGDMLSSGLVREADGNLVLTRRGIMLARVYSALRSVANTQSVNVP
jgi:hypothetical protein